MSGIPRDYRGINQYPQVIRCRPAPSAVFTVVVRELSREQIQAVVRELERAGALSAPRLSCFDMVAGNGAAKGNQADTHTSPPNTGGDASVSGDHGPSSQQSAEPQSSTAYLIQGLIRAAQCNENIESAAAPLRAQIQLIEEANLRLLDTNAALLKSGCDLVDAACRDENTIGRMRSGITEAIALLESGTKYQRMHVAGTLRGAL